MTGLSRRRRVVAGLASGALTVVMAGAMLVAAHQPSSYDSLRKKAQDVSERLTTQLRRLLEREIAAGGFEGGVRVCSEVAQKTTREFSRQDGQQVRRVSLKYRNPADEPDRWEAKQLRKLEKALKAGASPEPVEEVVETDGKRFYRYLKPIVAGPVCLQCHGQTNLMMPEVRKAIAKAYPRDLATGYRAGDLRGAVSVMIRMP